MVELAEMKKEAEEIIDGMRDRMVDLSYEIHEHPELSYEEYRAKELLAEELEAQGFQMESGLAGLETSFRGEFHVKESGPTICLMVEYDALKDLGHACGHNLSGVASLGAATAVKEIIDRYKLSGKIVALGTPGEELYSGKIPMVEAGVFEDVDVAMMAHMFDRTVIDPKFIAMEGLEFKFQGEPSHAAGAPEEGINALNGVIQTFENINALRQHVKDGVRIHGIVTHGGSAINIVPEEAAAKFFVRADSRQYLDEVVEKVKKCGKGAAVATGADVEINSFESNDDLENNSVLTVLFSENIRRYTDDVIGRMEKSIGSTDVGNVSKVVPTIHPMVAITSEGTALHTKGFAEATASESGFEGMITASKGLALTAVDLIYGKNFLKRAQEAFEENNE